MAIKKLITGLGILAAATFLLGAGAGLDENRAPSQKASGQKLQKDNGSDTLILAQLKKKDKDKEREKMDDLGRSQAEKVMDDIRNEISNSIRMDLKNEIRMETQSIIQENKIIPRVVESGTGSPTTVLPYSGTTADRYFRRR